MHRSYYNNRIDASRALGLAKDILLITGFIISFMFYTIKTTKDIFWVKIVIEVINKIVKPIVCKRQNMSICR